MGENGHREEQGNIVISGCHEVKFAILINWEQTEVAAPDEGSYVKEIRARIELVTGIQC